MQRQIRRITTGTLAVGVMAMSVPAAASRGRPW